MRITAEAEGHARQLINALLNDARPEALDHYYVVLCCFQEGKDVYPEPIITLIERSKVDEIERVKNCQGGWDQKKIMKIGNHDIYDALPDQVAIKVRNCILDFRGCRFEFRD